MTLTRRYLLEYARRPLNLVLLLVVPVIYVTLAADALADFARLLGATADPATLAAPTAGWAAAFLAGVAGFFHVLSSREADRRLAAAGMGALRVVGARLASGLGLAALATGGALAALWVSVEVADPLRAVGGTAAFALIYLALGVGVGALVRNEVNGSLMVIFVWMLDVFLGPAMGGGDLWVTRTFPSHFVTLVMMDAASGHGGPLSDVGWAGVWTLGALVVAGIVFWVTTRPRGGERRQRRAAWRLRGGLRYGFREYRRNVAMWVMLALLPMIFITLSFAVTPDDPAPVTIREAGQVTTRILSMVDVHGAIMVPITVAFLSGLAGLFVVLGSREADRRLAVAGFRAQEVLASRLGVIALAALLATGVSLAVTAVDFSPERWSVFAGATLLVGATFGMLGVLAGSLFGRLGGLYLMFLVPFLDVGLAQNVMFAAAPPAWSRFMPAHGAVRVLLDGAFSRGFDEAGSLLLGLGWLLGITIVAALVFHRLAEPERA